MKNVISPQIESEIRDSVQSAIVLITEQVNLWGARGYTENFVERGIELVLGAAEAELRNTFTPEFSATIAAEIRRAVDFKRSTALDRKHASSPSSAAPSAQVDRQRH